MNDKLQTNLHVTRLYDENKVIKQVTKVGILPFIVSARGYGGGVLHDDPAGESARSADGGSVPPMIKILFMKPRTEAKHLGAPAFQIAKGTRRINVNGNWCDMREEDLRYADESFHEPLLSTALREGEEEIGLKPSNISKLYDMGDFTFVSASRGIIKPLHMFAAEIIHADDFASYEATTSETRWMTPEEFISIGRPDHVKIMQEIVGRLRSAFFTGI